MEADDKIKSIERAYPGRIPVGVGILPAAWMKQRDALDDIVRRHSLLFPASTGPRDYDAASGTYVAGEAGTATVMAAYQESLRG